MMSWVKNHRPPLVILENVCGAPWERVVDYFERNGYSAGYLRVDTKTFYIPHTRTRVYLLAVDKKGSRMPDTWKTKIGELKRPASSTLDAFLLPTDDPRIHQARQKLANEAYQTVGGTRGRTDWGRCENRHQRARLEEQLGTKRPLTSWEEGETKFLFIWVKACPLVWRATSRTKTNNPLQVASASFLTLHGTIGASVKSSACGT